MKKLFKILPVILIIIVCSFVMIKVFADNKLEVKEYVQGDVYTAVLYSNNQLYIWGNEYYDGPHFINKIIDNIRDITMKNYYDSLNVIDMENNYKIVYFTTTYNDEIEDYIYEIKTTETIKSNIKSTDGNENFLTNDNKLYNIKCEIYSQTPECKETLIMKNVKDYSYNDNRDSYLILDNDNNLYAYGTNIYGKKINDGENITLEPLKIAENIKSFSNTTQGNSGINGNFYITNDNELYIISSELPYPKLLKKNVSKFLYNNFYISEGKTYQIDHRIKDDKIEVIKDELILNDELISTASIEYSKNLYLTKNGDLYDSSYYNTDCKKIYSNIKQLFYAYNDSYIIKEDGTLSKIKYSIYNNYYPESGSYREEYILREYKQLTNVKKVINYNTLIMDDDTIYVKGSSSNHDIADFNGKTTSNYNKFAVIKGLPNVKETITLSQLNLHHNDKTNLSVGETVDYYVDIYPFNAENKEIEWTSSDESIVKVSQKGTLTTLKAGTTTIKVKSKTLDISDEVTITVHPKNTGLEILGEEEIKLERYEYKMLTAKITPDNVLEQKIKWTSDAGKDEDGNAIIRFYGINEDYNTCNEEVCPKKYNEIAFSVRKAGIYTITATTEDGLFSDSIKVNVTQGITDISIRPNVNNYLGNALYIYMKESKTMDLKTRIYPEDATDKEIEYETSDPTIATVDEKGIVTAKKAGKVTITIKAKNNDVKVEYVILIFDQTIDTKLGDVDGDGIVDILDVVKLRRHVAGVEALQ